jgi:hypothetical protein
MPAPCQHVWTGVVSLHVCKSVQVPGVNPATRSASGTCLRCGVRRSTHTVWPSGELVVTDRAATR